MKAANQNMLYKRNLEFVACTNLYALTEEHLKDIKEHKIMLSTSLDGPKQLHDLHRCLRKDGSSYDTFVEKLKLARDALGYDSVNALMTTSADSLSQVERIIDEYRKLEFNGIFFRALNPYGDAYKNKLYYSPDAFVEMYKRGLEYIVAVRPYDKLALLF